MKKNFKMIVVCLALLVTAIVPTGCGKEEASSKAPKQSVSELQQEKSETSTASSSLPSEETVSDASVPQESSERASQSESSDADVSVTVSTEDGTSSSTSQEDSDGYFSDDEQISSLPHEEASSFTDNEKFNELFDSNSLDAAYTEEMLNNGITTAQMREITQKYSEKWKEEADKAYNQLSELLADQPDDKADLDKTQTDWKNGTESVVSSYYEEGRSGEHGTMGMIVADTNVLNYYKARAAVLYEQIYNITGAFEL